MSKRSLIIPAICLCFAISGAVTAQPYVWENFTSKGEITSLASDGANIWVTTTGGVVRLDADGNVQKSYINSDGLGSVAATFVTLAGDGIAYFGSSDGYLSELDIETEGFDVTRLRGREGEALTLTAAAVDGEYLWIATDIGILKYDRFRHGGEVKETYRTLGDFPAETAVLDLIVFDTLLLAATPRGLAWAPRASEFLLDPNSWATIKHSESGFNADTATCFALLDETLYVGSDSGLYKMQPDLTLTVVNGTESWKVLDLNPGSEELLMIATNGISRTIALVDVEGNISVLSPEMTIAVAIAINVGLLEPNLVLGTDDLGLHFVEDDNSVTEVSLPGPSSNDLIGGGVSSDGTIYAASLLDGYSLLRNNAWTDNSVTHREISAALVDSRDNLWLGSFGDGVFRVDPAGEVTLFNKDNSPLLGNDDDPSLSFVVINDIAEAAGGDIWFSSFRGSGRRVLLGFNPIDSLWAYYEASDGIVADRSQAVAAGSGFVALGDANQGLTYVDYGNSPFEPGDDILGVYSTSRRLPSGSVSALVVDLDNTLWVGTNLGLAYFDAEIGFFFPIALPDGISSDVRALTVDTRNNLWVGTTGGLGFISFGQTRTATFTTDNSHLLANDIRALSFDEHSGRLLIFTAGGLSILDYNLQGVGTTSAVLPYPNPFEVGETLPARLRFTLGQRAEVRIYNVAGELVRFLQQTEFDDGWDGRNDFGTLVASGVYIFELVAETGERHQGKILLVRR
jgi:hypothetical protein